MQRYRIDRLLDNIDLFGWSCLGQNVRFDNQGNGTVVAMVNGHVHWFVGCTLSEILETLDELLEKYWEM